MLVRRDLALWNLLWVGKRGKTRLCVSGDTKRNNAAKKWSKEIRHGGGSNYLGTEVINLELERCHLAASVSVDSALAIHL